jgi:uncharacterized protein (DUF1330 family)
MTAYVVFEREATIDTDELALYAGKVAAARVGHAAKSLVTSTDVDMLEGRPIERVVIMSFPTAAEARAWYDSPAYQAVLVHRLKGAVSRSYIVEGLPGA